MEEVTFGNLYELNKEVMRQLPPQSPHKIKNEFDTIGSWFGAKSPQSKYFMLMCKEKSDFTFLHLNSFNFNRALEELKETIDERGIVHFIQYVHGEDAFEIWVQDEETKEVSMYMLFDADWMVVEVW